MSAAADRRYSLIDRAAEDAATSWATASCDALTREGRRVEGGWPGTIREARARGVAEATRALAAQAMGAPTSDERDRITRVTYEQARRSWAALAR